MLKQMKTFQTSSAAETQALAKRLGRAIKTPITLLLSGDLGSGKTTFTQGLARGLDVKEPVSSPSFTIMKNYSGRLTLNHIDAYRIEAQALELGLEEVLDEGVTVIEWPDFVSQLWPHDHLRIHFTATNETQRTIECIAHGDDALNLLNTL